jgi:hypothetical protein
MAGDGDEGQRPGSIHGFDARSKRRSARRYVLARTRLVPSLTDTSDVVTAPGDAQRPSSARLMISKGRAAFEYVAHDLLAIDPVLAPSSIDASAAAAAGRNAGSSTPVIVQSILLLASVEAIAFCRRATGQTTKCVGAFVTRHGWRLSARSDRRSRSSSRSCRTPGRCRARSS